MNTRPLPPVDAVNRRLAAVFHQRQATLVVAAISRGRRVHKRVRELVRQAVAVAASRGLAAMHELRQAIDRIVDAAVDIVHDELVAQARQGWETAVGAIVNTVPVEVLGRLWERGPVREARLEVRPVDLLTGIPRAVAGRYVAQMIFPQPDADTVERWLTERPPGGMNWDERLRRWANTTRAAMLNELVIGIAAGEAPDDLEQRLRPLADALAYKSERIARTEAVRVAQRANLAACRQLGNLLSGYQVIAVMDAHTRPHHATRHGRMYWRGEDGLFRDSDGNLLPDLPDEPNCRCMTVPVLDYREVGDLTTAGTLVRASGHMPPAPSVAGYDVWWDNATAQERMAAVGVQRYRTAQAVLGREPSWFELVDQTGRLLSPEELLAETPEARAQRVAAVRGMVLQQELAYLGLTKTGMLPARIPGLSVAEVIEAVEDVIRKQPVEYLVTIGADGTILFVRRGESTHVDSPEEERRLLEGAICTHNHPMVMDYNSVPVDSLSFEDVMFAIREGLTTMRAASPTSRHIMTFAGLPEARGERVQIAQAIGRQALQAYQEAVEECRREGRGIRDRQQLAELTARRLSEAVQRIWRSLAGGYIASYQVIRG